MVKTLLKSVLSVRKRFHFWGSKSAGNPNGRDNPVRKKKVSFRERNQDKRSTRLGTRFVTKVPHSMDLILGPGPRECTPCLPYRHNGPNLVLTSVKDFCFQRPVRFLLFVGCFLVRFFCGQSSVVLSEQEFLPLFSFVLPSRQSMSLFLGF